MTESSRLAEIDEMTAPKRTGRRPLPDAQRRVQFGTRILPSTLEGLKSLAEQKNLPPGRVIDDLVTNAVKLDLNLP